MKTKLRIHTWPESILRKKCAQVTVFDQSIIELFDEMLTIMRVSDGAGLAGNQVGLDLQLVVIELENKIYKLANPSIIRAEGSIVFREGCLSFPGLEVDVKRKRKIWVKACDERGQKLDLEIEGVLAVVFQHEIDHVNGITFIDRISMLQKIKIYPCLKRISRNTKNDLRKQNEKP
jgi:peptide deformylase